MGSWILRWRWVTLIAIVFIVSDINATDPSGMSSNSGLDCGLSHLDLPQAARRVIEQPTFVATGPTERFRGNPALYLWLLEHPDHAMKAWRRLGARGRDIADLGSGRFTWNDGSGTTVTWDTIYRDQHRRIWYAEGTSQPARFLPTIPVRAVVVMHYSITRDGEPPMLQHKAELFMQTDSRTAQLIARMLGPSGPRMAEQGLTQLELFFSALVAYLERYPEHASALRKS